MDPDGNTAKRFMPMSSSAIEDHSEIIMRVLSLIIIGIFAVVEASAQISVAPVSKVENVKYCEMMKAPDAYIGKDVRVSATLKNLIAESILTANCSGKHIAVVVGLLDEFFETLTDELYTDMASEQTSDAGVVVVGRLLGPGRPDGEFNYGHYGWSNYQFQIHKFEKIERSISSKAKPKQKVSHENRWNNFPIVAPTLATADD